MKKILLKPMILCSILIMAVSVFAGCGKTKDKTETGTSDQKIDMNRKWPSQVTYSNLNDQESQDLLKKLMTDAGVTKEKQKVLFQHIDQINHLLPDSKLTNGFETMPITETKYDPYDLQDKWDKTFPEFMGYNCRITSYTMFSDFIETAPDSKTRTDLLMMDLSSLDTDASATPDGTEKFEQIFSAVPTENTKDAGIHLENLRKDWKKRGISFKENPNMSMISLVLHDQIDEDQLFIGHTGILFPAEDGTLYFLEKIAFQEPYQLCRFNNRAELSDYFMKKYDTDYSQTSASPLVLENDSLIEGYRVNDQKEEAY